jgi:phosphate starvation-inducible PhoH-like protein
VALFGEHDRNLSALERLVPIALTLEGTNVRLSGREGDVESARRILDRMIDAAKSGAHLTPDDVALAALDMRSGDAIPSLPQTLIVSQRGKEIRPRSPGQRAFVEAIERSSLIFGIGPAGTGKTFLAMVMAVRALRARQVSRIVLARPAVEAGEKLGFLPGDMREKVDPYLRPLYDALAELLDFSAVEKFIERGTIEVAPLAYMRGRTLSDAFVILDEAQNATREQLKMFLTRLGLGSKMVVNGDITQIDLPRGVRSGLPEAKRLFGHIDGIGIVELHAQDVVRNPLITKIIAAYANADRE